MTVRKRRIVIGIIAAAVVVVLAALVYVFEFTSTGYRMTVPYRSTFVEAADHVYVQKDSLIREEDALRLTKEAQARVTAFYGELQCPATTYIILWEDPALLSKLGGDHDTCTVFFPSKRHYVSVSKEYLELDILAHELTHAELHTRLDEKVLRALPTWFDEGLATQNDYRPRYSEAAWQEQTENGARAIALEDMDTPDEFYAGTSDERRSRYVCAKHEVRGWMDAHGQAGLLALLDALASGEPFETAYGMTDPE